LEWDSLLGGALRRQAHLLMDMGPSSGLGIGIHPESIPMQTFAKFMFVALLPFDADLAFKVKGDLKYVLFLRMRINFLKNIRMFFPKSKIQIFIVIFIL